MPAATSPTTSVLLRGEETDGRVSVTEIEIPAHNPGPPLHTHDFDEAFYVLDGELIFQIEDALVTKAAGELVFAPRNVAHALANHSDAPARYVLICTPAGFERHWARNGGRSRRGRAAGVGAAADPRDHGRRPADRSGASVNEQSPSQRIDARIEELGDWRGETLARVRALISEADPDVVEEFKWAKASSPGTPVWEHDGIICTGETYRDKVKLTFAKGASLEDPAGLFNSSLDGNVRRAIDIHEGEEVDEQALKALVQAAVDLNKS